MTRKLCFSLFLVVVPAIHASTVFNFDSDSPGTYTPFTAVSNGLSATFTSNGDPGGFKIAPTFFKSLTGNVLLDPGPSGDSGLVLMLTFSQAVSAISLDFGLNTFLSSDTFTLSAYQAGKLVGAVTDAGAVPVGFDYPEATVLFAAGSFNSVTLSSTALDLAVDNITVTTSTPEPRFTSALGLSLLSGGFLFLRRRFECKPKSYFGAGPSFESKNRAVAS